VLTGSGARDVSEDMLCRSFISRRRITLRQSPRPCKLRPFTKALWQAACVRVVVLHLPGDLLEIFGIVAELHGWQTLRCAGIGLTFHPRWTTKAFLPPTTWISHSATAAPALSRATKLVSPKPLPVTTIAALLEQSHFGDCGAADDERLGPSGDLHDAGLVDRHHQGLFLRPQRRRIPIDYHGGDQTGPVDCTSAARIGG
jgi:hypothetical protein